jgi:hypothetical protein
MTAANRVNLPLAPRDCRHFDRCSAPICPPDPRWRSAAHLPGERVCLYLVASGKAGASDYYRDEPAFAAVLEHAAEVLARHSHIRRVVAQAAGKKIRGENLARGRATIEQEGLPR